MNSEEDSKQEQGDELVQRMRQWQEAHPGATLTEMEEAVEAELAVVRKRLVEGLAAEREAADRERPNCPECGAEMVRNGRRGRRLKGKEGQDIELDRQQWRCLLCGATLFPPG